MGRLIDEYVDPAQLGQAVLHMQPGSAIINTASTNSDAPNPTLLAYATTKGATKPIL
jgi:NAD(P)-dependent dehydrogenase (short-subunit alcohol dehydrogenase family)